MAEQYDLGSGQSSIAFQHATLCHPDGSPCLDGCDAQPVYCRCEAKVSHYRRAGWLVCAKCGRAMPSDIREPVFDFAWLMEKRLRENDHKGGWDYESVWWLWERAMQEMAELGRCLATGNVGHVQHECADVANFCMMIADNTRRRGVDDAE